MTPWPARKIIRLLVRCTSVERATRQIEDEAKLTIDLVESLAPERIAEPATVGFMPGVDADMRGWSLGQILEHNTIVNRAFTRIVDHMLRGEIYRSTIDTKRDVMPGEGVGIEQVELFRASVDAYLERAGKATPAQLAATAKHPHPLFGPFTAKHWHAMFGFHLKIHRRQAEQVAKKFTT